VHSSLSLRSLRAVVRERARALTTCVLTALKAATTPQQCAWAGDACTAGPRNAAGSNAAVHAGWPRGRACPWRRTCRPARRRPRRRRPGRPGAPQRTQPHPRPPPLPLPPPRPPPFRWRRRPRRPRLACPGRPGRRRPRARARGAAAAPRPPRAPAAPPARPPAPRSGQARKASEPLPYSNAYPNTTLRPPQPASCSVCSPFSASTRATARGVRDCHP